MATRPPPAEPAIQLTTRIPKSLHVAIRIHCVETEQSIMDFVEEAMEIMGATLFFVSLVDHLAERHPEVQLVRD